MHCCSGTPLFVVEVVRGCLHKVQCGIQCTSVCFCVGQDTHVCSNHLHLQVFCKFDLLMRSHTCFCNRVIVTFPFLCRALALCAAVLNACWALVFLAGFFLSSGLVYLFLAIAMVVIVVDVKEREKSDDF